MSEYKVDLRPYGWCEGDYLGRCRTCGKSWSNGDKRAWACKNCASVAFTAHQLEKGGEE